MNNCLGVSDVNGDHLFSCKAGGNAVIRHESVKKRLSQICSLVGIDVEIGKEILGLFQDDSNDRPADIYIRNYGSMGQPLAVDVSIVTFNAVDSIKKMESSKVNKYEERLRRTNIFFTPFVCNSIGTFGDSTTLLLNKMATLYSAKIGISFNASISRIKGQISFAVQYQQANNVILATSNADYHREELRINVAHGATL